MQQLTQDQKDYLSTIVTGTWVQNSKTGLIDVDGAVNLSYENLTKIPYKFGKVAGYFDCNNNQLTTLKGCPETIQKSFYCYRNQLTSLEGGPELVKIDFDCFSNPLDPTSDESLEYFKKIGYKKINFLNEMFEDYLINLGFEENSSSFKTIIKSLYKKIE